MDCRRSINYTLICGVDRRHLRQLHWTWPTWKLHKPSLLQMPMIVFYDRESLTRSDIQAIVDHPRLTAVPWPPENVEYRDGVDKWHGRQRKKMLSGFVHVAAQHVTSHWYLKLDTDVVATGQDDWIDPEWFADDPGIVSHPWGYTKPPYQMALLDEWVRDCRHMLTMLHETAPLHLIPGPGASLLKHPRIISWCGFFSTSLTRLASQLAIDTCGPGQLPVPSQDGYLWYLAARLSRPIKRIQMKRRGWQHWSSDQNVEHYAREAMASVDGFIPSPSGASDQAGSRNRQKGGK